jgi:D-glutamate cyclase
MSDLLTMLRDSIQTDVGRRGLARDPVENLFTYCAGDFAAACRSIAGHPAPQVAIVTGFMILGVDPPTGETDGPPGALFLAECLRTAGAGVTLLSDEGGYDALRIGLEHRGLSGRIALRDLRDPDVAPEPATTHLIALERSGPNVDGINFNMRGRDITSHTAPAHRFFEGLRSYTTIGIGDGGNEIGMGKIPREVIERNIPNGGTVACRVATDHLIVAGISNWGGYALGAGVMALKNCVDLSLFEPDRERETLRRMVESAPLVDGVRGAATLSVDGLDFDEYAKPLWAIRRLLEATSGGSRSR